MTKKTTNIVVKKILQIALATVSSLLLAYLTFLSVGLGSMGLIPGETDLLINRLFYANVLLVFIAVILSVFLEPRWSFLIFVVQCSVFAGVMYAYTYLRPAEKERNLRADYKRINTSVSEKAEIILECDEGYRVAFLAPRKLGTGRTVSQLYLLPSDLEDEPHQVLSWADGNAGKVFIKHSHQHLEAILPSCRNETMSFDDLVARVKNIKEY